MRSGAATAPHPTTTPHPIERSHPRSYSPGGKVDTMPQPICATPGCDHPTHDAHICWDCTTHLTDDLREADDLAHELEITLCKQDRIHDPQPRGATIPLPYRPHISEVAWVHHATLGIWIRHLTNQRPPSSVLRRAAWLTYHLDTIRRADEAGIIVDEIGYATDVVRRAVDRPPVLHFLGPCECGPDHLGRPVDIYARPGAIAVDCRSCNTPYNVADRREWLLKQAEDQLLTATECSRALPGLLGDRLTADMIRGWAHRGRLALKPPHPLDPRQHPRYRVGDVIDTLADIRNEENTTPRRRKVCA